MATLISNTHTNLAIVSERTEEDCLTGGVMTRQSLLSSLVMRSELLLFSSPNIPLSVSAPSLSELYHILNSKKSNSFCGSFPYHCGAPLSRPGLDHSCCGGGLGGVPHSVSHHSDPPRHLLHTFPPDLSLLYKHVTTTQLLLSLHLPPEVGAASSGGRFVGPALALAVLARDSHPEETPDTESERR